MGTEESTDTFVIKLAMVGLDSMTRNSITLLVSGYLDNKFELSDLKNAHIALVDMDAYQIKVHIDAIKKAGTLKNIICLSVDEKTFDNHLSIKKPIKLQALIDALETQNRQIQQSLKNTAEKEQSALSKTNNDQSFHGAKQTLETKKSSSDKAKTLKKAHKTKVTLHDQKSAIVSNPIGGKVPTHTHKPVTQATQEITIENHSEAGPKYVDSSKQRAKPMSKNSAYKLPSEKANRLPFVKLVDEHASPLNTFNPNSYFLGTIMSTLSIAKNENKAAKITNILGEFLLVPDWKKVYSNIPPAKLRSVAFIPLQSSDYKTTYLSYAQLESYSNHLDFVHLEKFLWDLSLWTSRGRLPEGTDTTKPIKISRWPNLTRLTPIPHCTQVIAAWQKKSLSLNDTVKKLSVPEKHVFGLYSSMYFNHFISEEDPVYTEPPNHRARHKAPGLQTIFKNLLGKLNK